MSSIAPRTATPARSYGIFFALLLLIVGIVAIREALVSADVVSGSSYWTALFDRVTEVSAGSWLLGVIIVAAILGLHMIYTALRPRRVEVTALKGFDEVFVKPKAVRRLAVDSAEGIDGVISVKGSTRKAKVYLAARATKSDQAMREEIRRVAARRLTPLQGHTAVDVRVKQESEA